MKKRILAILLAAVLVIGLSAPALALPYGQEYVGYTAEGGQQYSDVPTTHWAYSSIETCSQRGWFNGYPDGTFRPNGLIRRDEAAKVFAVAMGLTLEENPTVTYTDTADSWAKAHIEATKALFPNVANLQGTASFRPEQTITREETIYALLVAWRYASKTTNADLSVLNMFSDVNSISAGVKPYMAVAVSEGLVSGLPDGTIAAQKGLTRAEFAALLARALSHGYGSDTTDTPVITVNRYAAETTEDAIVLTGKVSPVSTGTKLTLDGESLTLRNGSFEVLVALELGENSFTLEAKNAYGVRDSKVVRITRTEPEPEPSPEPLPSPAPDPEPTKEPEPSKQPEPSKNPDPVKDPETKPGLPSGTVVNLEELEADKWKYRAMLTGEDAEFKQAGKIVTPFNRLSLRYEGYGSGWYNAKASKSSGYVTYQLDSQYSLLNGTFDIIRTKEYPQKVGAGLAFYSIDKWGDEILLQRFFTKESNTGVSSIDVQIDLSDIDTLKIVRIPEMDERWPYDDSIYESLCTAELYNVTLTVK